MEFYCHYCRDWYGVESCQMHFESIHGQQNVTFDALKDRLAFLGGLDVRDETSIPDEKRPVFVTNNFRHVV